ncbi:hypothetical protein GQ457_01G013870 [Hibiscus cannabinus]
MAPMSSGVGNPATTLSSLFLCPRLSSLFLHGLRSFIEEPFLHSREFQSPVALWSNFRRFREIERWGCRPKAGFSEGDGTTVIFELGKGVGRATFLCARSWLSRPLCKIRPQLEFPTPPYLSCKLRPPLKPPFSSFCSLAKFPLTWWMAFLFLFLLGITVLLQLSVSAGYLKFWVVGAVVWRYLSCSTDHLMPRRADPFRNVLTDCLNQGSLMIRPVSKSGKGAYLFLELSHRSCFKLVICLLIIGFMFFDYVMFSKLFLRNCLFGALFLCFKSLIMSRRSLVVLFQEFISWFGCKIDDY